MTAVAADSIRGLFSNRRPIDRPIEKVIDYYANDDTRLEREVEEYEVTDSVSRNLRRFLDFFGDGVRTGQVSETGIWVSGFYGSGKSSFTKYLGFALDPNRMVGSRKFLELFRDRIADPMVSADLVSLATKEPTAVVMLDLGSEQLASSSISEVTQVLYQKVLQWAGYSKIGKLSELEFRLEQDGKYQDFLIAYSDTFGGNWAEYQNDPLLGIARADQLVGRFYPGEYGDKGSFRNLHFTFDWNVRDQTIRMLDLVQRRSGKKNVLFLIDEVGQYVATRGELILNLDGLARNLKELGKGRAWIVATAQQTLTEIVERAAANSTELNKLQDRFPITISLDAGDIREITHLRLLAKSADGEDRLRSLFRKHGQALAAHTRLRDTILFRNDPTEDDFVKFYPFLPQHFDVMMELVRGLARARGSVGLRSAIRVIQDVLIDASRSLPPETPLLVDYPVGTLATADAFYDVLRADIGKLLPHVNEAVKRIALAFPEDDTAIRIGKAIGALQIIDGFPRTVENIAALLYPSVGALGNLDDVRTAVERLLANREIGLFDDPQTGGLSFLSQEMSKRRNERDLIQPSPGEIAGYRSAALKSLFESLPEIKLDKAKTVRAGIRFNKFPVTGEGEEVQFQIETAMDATWNERRAALALATTGSNEWRSVIAWLINLPGEIDDVLAEQVRSETMLRKVSETDLNKDAAQFARAERIALDHYRERAKAMFRDALTAGIMIFRGKPTPAGPSAISEAASRQLQVAAAAIFPQFRLAAIQAPTDLASRFLSVERLNVMPRESDPLQFVSSQGGRVQISPTHETLNEALSDLRRQLDERGTSRLQGTVLLDHFAAAPYGWSKDAVRYVFAGLLARGDLVLNTLVGNLQNPGPAAAEAVKNNVAFAKLGVSVRDVPPSRDAIDRAATRLSHLCGDEVLPVEQVIAAAARTSIPPKMVPFAVLPYRLQSLGLKGEERAQSVLDVGDQLTRGDGSAALEILGDAGSTFVEDVRWAESAMQALDKGGELLIREARSVLLAGSQLERNYPGFTLLTESDLATIGDVLESESFADRLAGLRSALGEIRRRGVAEYAEKANELKAKLAADLVELERQPEWSQVTEDDRASIAGNLVFRLPESTTEDRALDDLNILLMRAAIQPALLPTAIKQVAEFAPKFVIDPVPGETRRVRLNEVFRLATLSAPIEIDAWLDEGRRQLNEQLEQAGIPITVE